jgi:dimethylglycine dehydrogenase
VFEVVAAECKAVAERVGVLDLSGFAKYEVTGPGAEAMLNQMCANKIPAKQGGIALVHMLSDNGRIQGEMTVTRLGDERFYCLSAAGAEQRDLDWLEQARLPGEAVEIVNTTAQRGVLVLSGPRSRDVLAKLTEADLFNPAFRWLSGQEIAVAGIPLLALRVSYVGELGWELHPAMADLPALYDAVWAVGEEFGIADYGLYAVNSMRMEKAYKGWGSELTNELTMIEAEMDRFIRFDKPDFTGKASTLDAPDRYRIVYGEVEAGNVDVRGVEPCMLGEECIGLTTSGGYGHRTGRSLFFACVPLVQAGAGSAFEIILQGERRAARVLGEPAYDPRNARMKV